MFQSFKQKLTPLLLFFFLVFQTIIGIFTPVDISFYPPYLEIKETLAASWYDSSWNYRKKITVDHTKVISGLDYDAQTVNFTAGYVLTGGTSGATATISADSDDGATGHLSLHTVTGTFEDDETIIGASGGSAIVNGSLTTPGNFPVLLTFDSTDTDFWGHCLAETEIVITSSDGISKLKREVEKFNYASEDLQLWFKAITLSSSVDTEFYIYYGNTEAEEVDDTEVWDSNFKMVQHMNESPANDTAGHLDSTSNANNGTPKNFDGVATSTTNGTGQIDGADVFDGVDDYVDVGDINEIEEIDALSVSAWVYTTVSDNPSTAGIASVEGIGPDVFDLRWASIEDIQFRMYDEYTAAIGGYTDGIPVNGNNEWYHIVGTYASSANSVKVYVNGVLGGTVGSMSGLTNQSTGYFKIGFGGSGYWDGNIDEVRISDTARSAEWIRTEYNNQSDNLLFLTFGSEDIPPACTGICKTNTCSIYVDCSVLLGTCDTGSCCLGICADDTENPTTPLTFSVLS